MKLSFGIGRTAVTVDDRLVGSPFAPDGPLAATISYHHPDRRTSQPGVGTALVPHAAAASGCEVPLEQVEKRGAVLSCSVSP